MYPPPHRTLGLGEGQAPFQGQGKYFVHPEAAWHSNTLGMWHSFLLAQERAVCGHTLSVCLDTTSRAEQVTRQGAEQRMLAIMLGNVY